MFRIHNEKSIELKRVINKWRLSIQVSFNVDPLKCPNCELEGIIPDSIYDEMGGKAKHKELKPKQKVSTIYCNRWMW